MAPATFQNLSGPLLTSLPVLDVPEPVGPVAFVAVRFPVNPPKTNVVDRMVEA